MTERPDACAIVDIVKADIKNFFLHLGRNLINTVGHDAGIEQDWRGHSRAGLFQGLAQQHGESPLPARDMPVSALGCARSADGSMYFCALVTHAASFTMRARLWPQGRCPRCA